jgi:hypothetical protein
MTNLSLRQAYRERNAVLSATPSQPGDAVRRRPAPLASRHRDAAEKWLLTTPCAERS